MLAVGQYPGALNMDKSFFTRSKAFIFQEIIGCSKSAGTPGPGNKEERSTQKAGRGLVHELRMIESDPFLEKSWNIRFVNIGSARASTTMIATFR